MSPVQTHSKESILEEVRVALEAEFGIPPAEVAPDTHLVDDLDLDSIDAVDLAARMEETTGLSLREEELKSVRRVGDVVDLLHAGLAARAGS